MSNYFSKFPEITYGTKVMRNLAVRVRLKNELTTQGVDFYNYTTRDTERPDTIAHDYYGDSSLAWLVMLANDIIDPYFDWALSSREFDAYIIDKYGSIDAAIAAVIHYKKDSINLYYKISDNTQIIDQTEYENILDKSLWALYVDDDNVEIEADSYNYRRH